MIYNQSVFEPWPIEPETIQAIITSPPYYKLRKYNIPDIKIGTWQGQYGLEDMPYNDQNSYIEHTRLWAREAWRVLRKDGLFFLNLADSYNGSGKGVSHGKQKTNIASMINISTKYYTLPYKCQLLIPHRVAMALVDDGWILRNTVIWYKSNALPESVRDRFSKKYEYIFMFSKSNKYYFKLDAVREPHKKVSIARYKRAVSNNNKWHNGVEGQPQQGINRERQNYKDRIGSMQSKEFDRGDYMVAKLNPFGKNPGDVWSMPTASSREHHYAVWPERLVDRMIRCSTKSGDIVLDPFAGSGTTIKKAKELQRIGIGIDLGYHDISSKKIKNTQKQMFV